MAGENEAAVRKAFAEQAEACEQRGSPFTGLLCAVLGETLDRSTELGRRVLDWQGRPDARGDSVPLRLAGGLHALVRRGQVPDLAKLYPPNNLPERRLLAQALGRTIEEAGPDLLPWLDQAPQTNEPMRSGPLMAGLLTIAERTGGMPLALYEVGASGGLMLMLNRYRHRLGEREAGDPASPVGIAPEWEGGSPPPAGVRIVRCLGSDLDPLEVMKPEDRGRLLAYIWPDQPERLARVEAAIAIAAKDLPRLARAEAAEWTERTIGVEPEEGACRVLMHAVALQYAPEETRERVAAHAAKVGAAATRDAPFAWLRFEADPDFDEQGSLRLSLWPEGREDVLAVGDTHGERLSWKG